MPTAYRDPDVPYVVLDTETIPSASFPPPPEEPELPSLTLDDFQAPANYKDPEKIQKYREEKLAKALEDQESDRKIAHAKALEDWRAECKRQSLHLSKSRICCLGYTILGRTPIYTTLATPLEDGRIDERGAIEAMVDHLKRLLHKYEDARLVFVGHNIAQFDAPRIVLRARKYQIDWLLLNMKSDRYKGNILDTMAIAQGAAWKDYVSLDDLAAFCGIKDAKSGDGSQVYAMWRNGQYDALQAYCARDVAVTAEVFERLCPLPPHSRPVFAPAQVQPAPQSEEAEQELADVY